MKKMLCTAFACVVGFFAVAAPLQASASEGTISANEQLRVGTYYTCTECGTTFVSLEEHEEGDTVECVVCGGTATEEEQPDVEVYGNPFGDKNPEKE